MSSAMTIRGVLTILTLAVDAVAAAGTDTILVPTRFAEGNEMSTDRPGFTESTDTILPGSLQLEGGMLVSRQALPSGTVRAIGAPFSLIRIGFTRFAELRLGTDGFTSESRLIDGQSEQHAGSSDLEVGIKARVWNERKYIPTFALIGALSVPTGSAYFSSGSHDPMLNLCWSKSLPYGFDASGNVNFRWDDTETEDAVSLSVGKQLNKGFRAYGEVYRLSLFDEEGPQWIVNTGITKLLNAHTQIDVEIGRTMGARTPYWFVGAGFAIRLSNLGIFPFSTRHKRPSFDPGS